MQDKDVADMVIRNYKLVKHDDFHTMLGIELNTAERNNTDPDWETLLELGQNKFEALVSQGIWGKRTAQEEQIFALQAQVKALQANQAPPRKPPAKPADKPPASPPAPTGSNQQRTRRSYENWQFKNPDKKTTLKKSLTIKGETKDVTYYWCTNHVGGKGMWARHKPSDCKNKGKFDTASSAPTGPPTLQARATVIQDSEE